MSQVNPTAATAPAPATLTEWVPGTVVICTDPGESRFLATNGTYVIEKVTQEYVWLGGVPLRDDGEPRYFGRHRFALWTPETRRRLEIPKYPIVSTRSLAYVVVGAGGIGARFAPLLAKLIRPQDKGIIVIDPDRVEERNLTRQHFSIGDVGEYKALVVGERIRAALSTATREISVEAITAPLAQGHFRAYSDCMFVLLGCVDNVQARQLMLDYGYQHDYCLSYIDAGNRMRSGQVITACKGLVRGYGSRLNGFHRVRKEWEKIAEEETAEKAKMDPAACAVRLDDQTVSANMMAADIMAAMVSMIIYGHPISTVYSEFSTMPPMVKPTMIEMADWL